MPKSRTYRWQDPSGVTLGATLVLLLAILRHALNIFIQVRWGRSANYHGLAASELTGPQLLLALSDTLGLVVLIAGIVLIFWILRASKNAHVLKGRGLTNSPLFAALWWYVIPFMSLFKPLEAMDEIWDVSAATAKRRKAARQVLYVWWVATLAAGMIGYGAIVSRHNPVMEALRSILAILQSASFIYIARRICSMQLEKRIANTFSDPERPKSVLERLND